MTTRLLPVIAFRLCELTLWRDGNLAVVTLNIQGKAIRILEADCRTMFYESVDADALRQLSDAANLRRAENRPPDMPELEAAE